MNKITRFGIFSIFSSEVKGMDRKKRTTLRYGDFKVVFFVERLLLKAVHRLKGK